MAYCFGDVLLVPFPFTNQAGAKQRPAVVVSSNAYNNAKRDLIIMAITSQVRQPLGFSEALIQEWQAAGLIKPSLLKPIITTIEQELVIKALGQVAQQDSLALKAVIQNIVG